MPPKRPPYQPITPEIMDFVMQNPNRTPRWTPRDIQNLMVIKKKIDKLEPSLRSLYRIDPSKININLLNKRQRIEDELARLRFNLMNLVNGQMIHPDLSIY